MCHMCSEEVEERLPRNVDNLWLEAVDYGNTALLLRLKTKKKDETVEKEKCAAHLDEQHLGFLKILMFECFCSASIFSDFVSKVLETESQH